MKGLSRMSLSPFVMKREMSLCILSSILAVPLGSCTQFNKTNKTGYYTFVVGPQQAPQDGADHRFHLTIPSRYISSMSDRAAETMEVQQINFPYNFLTSEPAAHDELGRESTVLGTISWAPPGEVKHRLDGSWQNYYSKYSVKGNPEFGLETAHGPDKIDTSTLLYSMDQGVMIECESILSEKPRKCDLFMSTSTYNAIHAYFPAVLLPRWHEVLTKTALIVGLHVK